MQKVHSYTKKCQNCCFSIWFQNLFTLYIKVLFIFPSQYFFTIAQNAFFSFCKWNYNIQTKNRSTQNLFLIFLYETITLLVAYFKSILKKFLKVYFSYFAFARHYLQNLFLFLYLVTQMVQFTKFLYNFQNQVSPSGFIPFLKLLLFYGYISF